MHTTPPPATKPTDKPAVLYFRCAFSFVSDILVVSTSGIVCLKDSSEVSYDGQSGNSNLIYATRLNSTQKSMRCQEILKVMLIYTATKAINLWCYIAPK